MLSLPYRQCQAITATAEAAMRQQSLLRRPDHCCSHFGACGRVQADGAVLSLCKSRPYVDILVLHQPLLLPSGAVSTPESPAVKARQQGLPLLGRFPQMQLCFARRQHVQSRAMSSFRNATYVSRALKGGIQRQVSAVDRSPGWRTCRLSVNIMDSKFDTFESQNARHIFTVNRRKAKSAPRR